MQSEDPAVSVHGFLGSWVQGELKGTLASHPSPESSGIAFRIYRSQLSSGIDVPAPEEQAEYRVDWLSTLLMWTAESGH